MPTKRAQTVLFLSSYSPLFALTGYLGTWGAGPPTVIAWVLAVVSPIGLLVFFRYAKTMHSSMLAIQTVRPRDDDAIGYVVTYILPFVVVISPSNPVRIAMVALLCLIAVLYVRGYLFYVNPILAICGFRLWEIELINGSTVLLLSRQRRLSRTTPIEAIALTDLVYLEK